MLRYSDPDSATRVGYMIADCFLVLFTIFMVYGMFLSR